MSLVRTVAWARRPVELSPHHRRLDVLLEHLPVEQSEDTPFSANLA